MKNRVLINPQFLTSIADAIREKNGSSDTYKPSQMGEAILAIQSGGGEEFIGIKHSDFDSYRLSPKTVDARSLPDENINFGGYSNLFANATKNPNGGFYGMMETVYLPKLNDFQVNIFNNCGRLKNIYGDFTNVKCIYVNAFYGCSSLEYAPYTPNITDIQKNAFYQCTSLREYKFYKKLNSISGVAFNQCTNLLDIYVPWSEGEVSDAPWGATNATIHYNTVYDENHEPIV